MFSTCSELGELVIQWTGLVDTRIGSEKDLPVIVHLNWYYPEENFLINLGFDSVVKC